MQHYVYVLAKDGSPLMPTKRYGKVRRMLKNGLAAARRTKPFTIQLLYDIDDPKIQDIYLSNDPGRTNIGLSAIRKDGKCIFRGKCLTRNKDIPNLMKKRRIHRQASRRGERLARKRLAKRLGTTMKSILNRKLPGYKDGVVRVKDIINTESRFNNRKRPNGWLTPTAKQLLQTYMNLALFVEKILPIKGYISETNVFDFARMENPKIKPWQYQQGPMYGMTSIKEAVSLAQHGTCLLCGKKPVEHAHHMIPRSRGGSDTLKNMVGLCMQCHEKVHRDDKALARLSKKKDGFNKKYGALSVLNQIISKLFDWATDRYDEVYVTNGWDTKQYREDYDLPKDHDIDAYAIGMVVLGTKCDDDLPPCYEILQFRRHDRQKVKAQVYRSYYLGKEKVAQNRHKATEAKVTKDGTIIQVRQTFDALDDWFDRMVDIYGQKEAEWLRSSLRVEKSTRRYNDLDRVLPGAVFYYQGKRYVMTGQLTNSTYFRAYGQDNKNFPVALCTIVSANTGLVVA